jgi:hypothetical protein
MSDIPVFTQSGLLVWSCRLVTVVWGLLALSLAALLSAAAGLLVSPWGFVSPFLVAVATGVAVITLEYKIKKWGQIYFLSLGHISGDSILQLT